MSEEIDGLIGLALSNVEAIDHLIGSPIEPFCEGLNLTNYLAPEFSCMVKDLGRLQDLIHSAEKSGFALPGGNGIPGYDPNKKDDQYVWIKLEKVFEGKTITFSVFVHNKVLFEYQFGSSITYQEG